MHGRGDFRPNARLKRQVLAIFCKRVDQNTALLLLSRHRIQMHTAECATRRALELILVGGGVLFAMRKKIAGGRKRKGGETEKNEPLLLKAPGNGPPDDGK